MDRTRRRGRWSFGLAVLASATLLGGLLGAPAGAAADADGSADASDKITTELVSLFEDGQSHDFWVKLHARADNTQARAMDDWAARGTRVAANLRATADRSQAPLRALLAAENLEYESFWIANAVYVKNADLAVARELAAQPAVSQIIQPFEYVQDEPIPGVEEPKVDTVEWNIDDINAPDVWQTYGATGEGIVVANIDTGVDYTHPALVEQYRGNLGGGEFDHDYNWFDVFGTSDFPVDDHFHGTHTMGTILGDDGGENQIGVAPGATWITSNAIMGTVPQFLEAMEWMLEPRDLDGENPDASKRPNVISNSWGVAEIPTDPFGDEVQQAWIDSGIFATWSNRNLGPWCNSTGSPGGRALSYSNGAYDIDHVIAGFSSRGPGQDGMIKPDISAPGVNVRSAMPGDSYAPQSGTSMSTPHTAGAVALLWSAASPLVGDIEATRSLLDSTAVDVDATECGGTVENNNVFGEGRLDVLAAFEHAPLDDAGVAEGRVTDASSGAPVAGAEIHLTGPSERHVTTDADGYYRSVVSVGSYDVVAHAFGYVDGEATVEVDEYETVTVNFDLEEAETVSLIGRVRERYSGVRLKGIPVSLAGTPLMTTTNARGGYRFPDVPVGAYAVTAMGDKCHQPRTKQAVIDGIWPLADRSDFDERKRFRLKPLTDAFGYSCRVEVPDYQEADTPIDLEGDEKTEIVDLPFAFPFYGAEYNSVQLSTNGHIRFVPHNRAGHENVGLPNPDPPNGVVAAFWDDLEIDRQATVATRTTADSFTMEYRDALLYDTENRVDFEITLFESGEIMITYRNLDSDAPLETGGSAGVGIENADGTIGITYTINTPNVLDDDTAVRFVPPTG